jgi:hypothetical protein
MGGRSLQEAFQACGEDITVEQAFLKYYIARESGASLELSERMLMDRRHVKALLTGQRGAGKSVELMRTAMDTRPGLLPLYVRLDLPGDRAQIPELLIATGQGMCKRLAELNLQASEQTVRSFTVWIRDSLKVQADDKGGMRGAEDSFCKVSERLRRRETRPELAAAIDARREELGLRLSELAIDVSAKVGKDVLLLLDGLERSNRSPAVSFLLESGLLDFQFKCICTMPFPVLHSPQFRSLRQSFDMISVQGLSETDDEAMGSGRTGALELRDIVDKRAGGGLIDDSAMDLLLRNCGGNPGDLLRFSGGCCLKASMNGMERIDTGVVGSVLDDHRMEMRRFLTPEEWARLYEIRRGKSETADETLASLLDSGAVLEHPGRTPMYQVHPTLLPVLDNRGSAL